MMLGLVGGCEKKGAGPVRQVVLYTSVDEPVARPIVEEFERRSGIRVVLMTDTEATKSVGLAERLEAEKDQPRADVWWGNEPFHTVNLAQQGAFAAYASPSAEGIPAVFKDKEGRWAGTALRVRVIARSTEGAGGEATAGLKSVEDLARPGLKGKVCMARPMAGTTSGHMAALYTVWGPAKTEAFFRSLKANEIRLVGGNSVVAELVGGGKVMWAGFTDNDDVDAMRREGGKLEGVIPDQGEGQMGTLAIPCTVGLVRGANNEEAGKKLVDYLLSKEVEGKLIEGKFARYSVFAKPGEGGVRAMEVDFAKVAGNLKAAVELAMKVMGE